MELAAALGPLAALTSSITWAVASTAYERESREHGSLRVGILRAITASSLWITVLALTDGLASLRDLSPLSALCLIGSICCSYVVGDRLFFRAASRIGVPSAMAIATVYPLWAALYGMVARAEPLHAMRAAGMLGCIAGVSLVLRLSRTAGGHVRGKAGVGSGFVLALLTSLFWAGNAVLLKQGASGVTLQQANSLRFVAGLILLCLLNALQPWPSANPRVTLPALGRRLFTVLLIDAGLGSIAYVYGIAHTDLALGATLSSLSPLVALPIAVALGHERFSAAKLLAIATTLAGVVLLVLS